MRGSILTCAVLCLALTASAAVITPSVSFAGGVYLYDYAVENDGPTSLIGFQLSLPIDPTNIRTPSGWVPNEFMDAGLSIIQWFSDDPSNDIQPGTSLSGFGFDAPTGPATVAFVVTDDEFNTAEGSTTGPSAIPEPGSGLLFSVALAMVAVFRVWRYL